jgi:effector-binding domain-containing protein
MTDYDVTLKKVEPQLIASVRAVMPNYGTLGQLYGEIFGYLGSQGITIPAGPTLFICYDTEFKEKDVDIEAGVPIAKAIPDSGRVKIYELPGMEQAACTVYKGPYENIGEAYSAIMAWAESNSYRITGPDRELYLTSPTDTQNPAEYVTEIQFPVMKA